MRAHRWEHRELHCALTEEPIEREDMRVAPKVIFLLRDESGYGPALAEEFLPNPSSNHTRSESSFELSLEKYGITDCKASCDAIQFIDVDGSPQVTILLVPNYEPPIAACAVNEILSWTTSESFCVQPTIIVPYITKSLKNDQELINSTTSEKQTTLYAAVIGSRNDLTGAVCAGTMSSPPTFRLYCETLACLLQMVRVLKLTTVFLIASASGKGTLTSELEMLKQLGSFIAGHLNLSFSKDKLQLKEKERSAAAQEPWRDLYG
ncbi:hypothetical protein AXF42_Ash010644 [Apostasia shenzhenica]|uniref:DUF7894 domain-containing protein n=1 Tax=Apostasia shenzhenica TaxID=1088818 RepID=A0A2I0A6P2_9ASPA|nr:hypothetical protein AXF42_Ash010644 [Apostasia shenzhenica]